MPAQTDIFEDFCALVRGIDHHVDRDDCRSERLLLDANVEGRRYLLVRLPVQDKEVPFLSPREAEIARLVAQGLPNKVIASVLEISTWTVGTHVRRLFAKLGVTSRAAMVARLSGFTGPAEPPPPRVPQGRQLEQPRPLQVHTTDAAPRIGNGSLDRLTRPGFPSRRAI